MSQAERKIMDIAKAGMVGETKTLHDTLHPGRSRGWIPASARRTSRSAASRRATSISTT
ncbi:MAG: hypothetical protein U0792_11665 [Gemmataceae bacterium]